MLLYIHYTYGHSLHTTSNILRLSNFASATICRGSRRPCYVKQTACRGHPYAPRLFFRGRWAHHRTCSRVTSQQLPHSSSRRLGRLSLVDVDGDAVELDELRDALQDLHPVV